VVILGWIKGLEGDNFGDDRPRIDLGGGELSDVGFRNTFLFVRSIENRGAVLRTGVRPLSVQLRGIMNHGKIDHQQLAVGDL